MKLRGILVARVSTKKQAKQDRFSIDSQFRMMRDCCERRGIEIVEERIEPGRSAYTPRLSDLVVLHQTILDIEAGMANCLVMHETTRLARNEQLGNHILDRLTECGAHFINSLMDIDYTTPEGRMVFNNEMSGAAYTSRKTSQHAKKGKREQFLQGFFVGQIPFGYIAPLTGDGKPNRKTAALVVPDEADAVRKAFDDYALGKSAHAIARELTAQGFVPRSTKGLTYFQPQTVREMIGNRSYLGEVQHEGEWRTGQHEAIITEEQFEAAQRPKLLMPRRKHPRALLAGIATCVAGHRLHTPRVRHSRKPEDQRRHAYYREPSNDFERPCPQSGRLWKMAEPDAQVEALLKTLALNGDWLQYVEGEARRGGSRDVEGERRRIQAKLDRLQEEYIEGRLPKDKWQRKFQECQTELARLSASETPVAVAAGQISSWWELWEQASPDTKNETCRLVFESVVLDFDLRKLYVEPKPEFVSLFDVRALYVAQGRPGRD